MKFFGYIARNARRNPLRSVLTVLSIAICIALMMILISFLAINSSVAESLRVNHRIVVMNSQGFAQPVPIARAREIAAMKGVVAVSPFHWYGGKYHNEVMPFAQFGVDADVFFTIYDELSIAPDQLKAFREDRAGCVIGRKLAEDRGLKVGDPLPLTGDTFPVDLDDLTVRGIYDGPPNRDRRMCIFHWENLDEKLKRVRDGRLAGNAGVIVVKCQSGDLLPVLSKAIDEASRNSDTPTRTQTEEAFTKMFAEMWGDMRGLIFRVGAAVVFSLICVAGNAMAMAMRERTTEVAVLKAIGFGKGLLVFLVLAEALLIAGLGGVLGAVGSKLFFDSFDATRYTAGFLPFFYVPWPTALLGLAVSLGIGLVSGLVPSLRAAHLSVVNGLRRVV
jgi:putative ABC transport system permease protein